LSLRGVDHANRDELQSVLAPFDVVASAVDSGRLRQHTRGAVLAHAATSLAEAAAWADSWTAVHAGIDLHEWQLAPAAAAVTGSCRILLADPVGLGKTIQAALIMAELCARGLADRVLILTPASI